MTPCKNHTEVTVDKLPICDLCGQTAHYDARTRMGPWASLCDKCFGIVGIGLGLGKGQRLVLPYPQGYPSLQ